MKKIVLAAVAAMIAAVGFAAIPDGSWIGKLELGDGLGMKLVLRISGADGGSSAVVRLDSPDQGVYGIEAIGDYLAPDSVVVTVPAMGVRYNASVSGDIMNGIFEQQGYCFPLVFKRGEYELRRPQMPQPPFPYATREVAVENVEAGVTLAGTLTVPEGADGDTPVVVMVTGSGLQNRDEELFGHKPFAVIADYLARNGIASLRYDDRGCGGSTGDPANVTTADNASDAAAVLRYVRSLGEFGKAGILGHSEGGSVGIMLAADKDSSPDFVIGIGAPAVRGDSILVDQNRTSLAGAGVAQSVVDEFADVLEKVLALRSAAPGKRLSPAVFSALCPGWSSRPLYKNLEASLRSSFADASPWIDAFITYSPSADLRRVAVPMLLLYGSHDTQVRPELNVGALEALGLADRTKVYAGLNHLMQHSTTGKTIEYGQIEETIAPEVLADIVSFISALGAAE